MEHQLLLYIGGAAGTGKSHVIRAIVELFKRCGYSEKLLVSATTGSAAVLIEGYTIHALTFLPQSEFKPKLQELENIWRVVKYLIIDELSMISALFLSQVSQRICKAKGWDPTNSEKPFGGVNVIFCGDFAQLPPVNAFSLFTHNLVGKNPSNVVQKPEGQGAMHGAYLWRLVDRVVLLKTNMRSKLDPAYTNLLRRVRSGDAWRSGKTLGGYQRGEGVNYVQPDYLTLRGRELSKLAAGGFPVAQHFHDAPVIVAEKVLRDAVNLKMVERFARETNQEMHIYYSRDRYARKAVTGEQRNRLWRVRSRITKDALGMLPLVPGMKVMIKENLSVRQKIVNGSEGILQDVKYELGPDGVRHATCAYVLVPGCGLQAPGLPINVVPVLPFRTAFCYETREGAKFNISRTQLPLWPAYAFTDYKSQGRSLTRAVVDLSGCGSLQSVYVMLSRVKSLDGLGILRWFSPNRLEGRLSQDFRNEFSRLEQLDRDTEREFERRMK
jgi:ATP-dependent DNA helicase PIF1